MTMILCFPQVHHNHTINYHFPLNNNMFVYLFIWKSAALMKIYYKLFSYHFITSRSHSINKGQLFFLFFPMEMVSSTRMKCACSYKKNNLFSLLLSSPTCLCVWFTRSLPCFALDYCYYLIITPAMR